MLLIISVLSLIIPDLNTISSTQLTIQKSITFEREPEGLDNWRLPVFNKGDCEDYVLLKRKLLIEQGIDENRLEVLVGYKDSEGHAILIIDKSIVLDNDYLYPESWASYLIRTKFTPQCIVENLTFGSIGNKRKCARKFTPSNY